MAKQTVSSVKNTGSITISQAAGIVAQLSMSQEICYFQSLPGIGKTMSMVQAMHEMNAMFKDSAKRAYFLEGVIENAKDYNHSIDKRIADAIKHIESIKFEVRLYDISGGTLSERELGGMMMPKSGFDEHTINIIHGMFKNVIDYYIAQVKGNAEVCVPGDDDEKIASAVQEYIKHETSKVVSADVIPHPFVQNIIDEYHSAPEKTVIIPLVFIDEIDRCFRAVQNELTTILLSRKINGVELPPTTVFVAAGNAGVGYDEIFNVIELNPVVLNRLVPITVEYSAQDFLSYAVKRGLNEFIQLYVTSTSKPIFIIDANTGEIECNPRKLERLARLLDSMGIFVDNEKFHITPAQEMAIRTFRQLGSDVLSYISSFSISQEYTYDKLKKGEFSADKMDITPIARIILLNKIIKHFRTTKEVVNEKERDNVIAYLKNQNQGFDLMARTSRLLKNPNIPRNEYDNIVTHITKFSAYVSNFAINLTDGKLGKI